jgi:outer membrane biosynthesis protein TonB
VVVGLYGIAGRAVFGSATSPQRKAVLVVDAADRAARMQHLQALRDRLRAALADALGHRAGAAAAGRSVTLQFRFDADRFADVQLVASSGDAALDRLALERARAVAPSIAVEPLPLERTALTIAWSFR